MVINVNLETEDKKNDALKNYFVPDKPGPNNALLAFVFKHVMF